MTKAAIARLVEYYGEPTSQVYVLINGQYYPITRVTLDSDSNSVILETE